MNLDNANLILSRLLEKLTWGARVSADTSLKIELGTPTDSRIKTKQTHGEWHLWIIGSAWRIEQKGELVAASHDDFAHLTKSVSLLNNLHVNSFSLSSDQFDAYLVFENEISLRWFTAYSNSMEHWMLFTPEQEVLKFGPQNEISLKPAHSPM